jgi:hypothetical protein
MRVRLLVPSIALIVATTMIPVGFHYPSTSYIEYAFNLSDFINNVFLYLPLGIALGDSSLTRAFFVGLCLSAAAESLQLGYVNRIPSLYDVIGNTCGALGGYLASTLWRRAAGYYLKSIPIHRVIVAAAIPVSLFGTLILVRHAVPSDFSNWSPSFDLAIGDELTGHRPWKGIVTRTAIYPCALDRSQIEAFARGILSPRPTNEASEPCGAPILELDPASVETQFRHPLLSKQDERRLYDTLVKRSRLTLLVWMRTGSLVQRGPARIVTYSRDASSRNFTLGQIDSALTFRLRTPASGGNGTDPALYSGPVLSLNRDTFVAAVYDGRMSRLYVDGKSVAQANLAARRPRLPNRIRWRLSRSFPLREIELSLSEIFLSSLFVVGLLGFVRASRPLLMRLSVGALGGFVIGATTWFLGVSEFMLGLRILMECIAAGVVVAASIEEVRPATPAAGSNELNVAAPVQQG